MRQFRLKSLRTVLIIKIFKTVPKLFTPYFDATIQAEEFGDCFEYFDDRPPVQVECEVKLQDKMMFSGLVIGLVGAGVVSLVKGVKGRWDQDVKPEDMVGPSHPKSDEPSNPTNNED